MNFQKLEEKTLPQLTLEGQYYPDTKTSDIIGKLQTIMNTDAKVLN